MPCNYPRALRMKVNRGRLTGGLGAKETAASLSEEMVRQAHRIDRGRIWFVSPQGGLSSNISKTREMVRIWKEGQGWHSACYVMLATARQDKVLPGPTAGYDSQVESSTLPQLAAAG